MSDRWNELISSTEMIERAGITTRMLDEWVRRGHVTPAIQAHGSGTQRRWFSWQIGEVMEERYRTQLVHVRKGFR